jgi:hypothetical protein
MIGFSNAAGAGIVGRGGPGEAKKGLLAAARVCRAEVHCACLWVGWLVGDDKTVTRLVPQTRHFTSRDDDTSTDMLAVMMNKKTACNNNNTQMIRPDRHHAHPAAAACPQRDDWHGLLLLGAWDDAHS